MSDDNSSGVGSGHGGDPRTKRRRIEKPKRRTTFLALVVSRADIKFRREPELRSERHDAVPFRREPQVLGLARLAWDVIAAGSGCELAHDICRAVSPAWAQQCTHFLDYAIAEAAWIEPKPYVIGRVKEEIILYIRLFISFFYLLVIIGMNTNINKIN